MNLTGWRVAYMNGGREIWYPRRRDADEASLFRYRDGHECRKDGAVCAAVCGAGRSVLETDPDRHAGRFGPDDRDATGGNRFGPDVGRGLQICAASGARFGGTMGGRGN